MCTRVRHSLSITFFDPFRLETTPKMSFFQMLAKPLNQTSQITLPHISVLRGWQRGSQQRCQPRCRLSFPEVGNCSSCKLIITNPSVEADDNFDLSSCRPAARLLTLCCNCGVVGATWWLRACAAGYV